MRPRQAVFLLLAGGDRPWIAAHVDDADLLVGLPRRALVDREETAHMGVLDRPERLVAESAAQDFPETREEGRHIGAVPPAILEVPHVLPFNPQSVEQLHVELDELRDFIEAERIMLIGIGVVVEDDTKTLERPGQRRGAAAIVADDENGVRQGDPLTDIGTG